MAKGTRRSWRRVSCLVWLLWLCVALPAFGAEPGSTAERKLAMRKIFAAIEVLLPAVLAEDENALASDEVRTAFETLASGSQALQAHAESQEPGFALLGRAFAWDVERIGELSAAGDRRAAGYALLELTQNCTQCHSRLPRKRDFALAERLARREELKTLPPAARARLLVATRAFEPALSLWEGMLADTSVRAETLDLEGVLLEYLTVAVRVVRDSERARKALAAFARRPDLPIYLRARVDGWRHALARVAPLIQGSPGLDVARSLMSGPLADMHLPLSRGRLVSDLAASSVLLRLASSSDLSPRERSEVYFRLAVLEARIPSRTPVPQTEFHLDSAIRAHPSGPLAKQAYVELEEMTAFGFGGLDASQVADETAAELRELWALIEAAAAAASKPAAQE